MGSIPITRSTSSNIMHRLYQARDRIEAQLLLHCLEQHRIDAVIFGDYLSGAAGELPADLLPTLWLRDERDLEPARLVLGQFLEPPAAPASAPWDCPTCGAPGEGDFDRCWNCGRARSYAPD